MTARDMPAGGCLCGAVTVTAPDLASEISGCHCEMCTRWSGSVQLGIEAPAATTVMSGPIKTHRSSSLAERGWCDLCGSAVFFRYVEGRDTGYLELAPGLFENFAGARLTRVVYADRAPEGFALAGDHDRISQSDYERTNPHLNDGAMP
jgi:hypothetical protein